MQAETFDFVLKMQVEVDLLSLLAHCEAGQCRVFLDFHLLPFLSHHYPHRWLELQHGLLLFHRPYKNI